MDASELKQEAAWFALARAIRDLKNELAKVRRRQRELDQEEDEGWP